MNNNNSSAQLRNKSVKEIWEYNPDQMPEEDFMATLVAREELVNDICNWLRKHKGMQPEKHLLYYGPRGIGKTTLVLAVFYSIQARDVKFRQNDLLDSFLPIRFSECTGEMSDEATFIRDTYELLDRNKKILGIEKTFLEFKFERNLDSLIAFSRITKRQFVFFIENLQDFIKGILESRGGRKKADQEKAFLEKLTSSKEMLLVTTSLYNPLNDRKKTNKFICEHFEPRELKGMSSFKEAGKLMEMRAKLDQDQNYIRRFQENFGRVRGVFALSKGNPRYLVVLYKILRNDSIEGIKTDFERILDGLTPVFETEMEKQLDNSLKPVLKALVKSNGQGNKTEVARQIVLPGEEPDKNIITVTGKKLSELCNTDFATTKDLKDQKEIVYEIKLPLFQLWYEMRILDKSMNAIMLVLYCNIHPDKKDLLQHYDILKRELLGKSSLNTDELLKLFTYSSLLNDFSMESIYEVMEYSDKIEDATDKEIVFNEIKRAQETISKLGKKQPLEKETKDLFELYEKREYKSVVSKSNKLIKFARETNNSELELHVSKLIANSLIELSEEEKAHEYHKRIMKLSQQLGDKELELKASYMLGINYYNSNDCNISNKYFEKSLYLAREINNSNIEFVTLKYLAILSNMIPEYDNACNYAEAGILLSNNIEDSKEKNDILLSLLKQASLSYLANNDYMKAINMGIKSYDLEYNLYNQVDIGILSLLAKAYYENGLIQKSIEFWERVLDQIEKYRSKEVTIKILENLIDGYWDTNNDEKQKATIEKLIDLAQETNDIELQCRAVFLLSRYYFRVKKFNEALKHAKTIIDNSRIEDMTTKANALLLTIKIYHIEDKYPDMNHHAKRLHEIAISIQHDEMLQDAYQYLILSDLRLAQGSVLENRIEKAKFEAEEAGFYLNQFLQNIGETTFEIEQNITRNINDILFIPLLKKENYSETSSLLKVCQKWNIEFLDDYLLIIEAIIPYLKENNDILIKRLKPVNHAIAGELYCQIKGIKSLSDLENIDYKDKNFLSSEEITKSLVIVEEFISEYPFYIETYRMAYSLYGANGDYANAKKYCLKAREISQDDPLDVGNYGMLLSQSGNTEEAISILIQAINSGSKEQNHYNELARIYKNKRELKKAYNILKISPLDVDPEDSLIMVMYGILSGYNVECKEHLSKIDHSELKAEYKSIYLLLDYLLDILLENTKNLCPTLWKFCEHLISFDGQTKWNFQYLLEFCDQKLSQYQSSLLNHWAQVINGKFNRIQFIQLYGDKEQCEKIIRESNNEQDNSLHRLRMNEIQNLKDVSRLSTRENACEEALVAFYSNYEDLAESYQDIIRNITLEALLDKNPTIINTAIGTVGGLFWKLIPEERAKAIDQLLNISADKNLSDEIRNNSIGLLGRLYFHLEKSEKKEISNRFKSISKTYKSRVLEDNINLIS